MKILKRSLLLLLTVCLLLSAASCGQMNLLGKSDVAPGDSSYDSKAEFPSSGLPGRAGDDSVYESSRPDSGYPKEYGGDYSGDYGEEVTGIPDAGWSEAGEPSGKQDNGYTAGLITASAWNENLHYDFWKSLFVKGQTEEDSGKFLHFYEDVKNRWGFDSTQRVTVTVKQGEAPVCGATVVCVDDSGAERFVAKTGADGVAYLFPEAKSGTLIVKSGAASAEVPFDSPTCEVEVQLNGAAAKQNKIQIMLVIDVTGSMGDELNYLQAEIEDVINRVAEANEGVQIELALLFYRDDGDDEKFAYHDFVNVNSRAGMNEQLKNLRGQRADGGGDYEEAVDEALELAMSKAWSEDSTTKIIFHLLDAPPHSNRYNPQRKYEERFEAAVRKAAAIGIRLCPILCSGADLTCEYLVRQEAIYTGGTFIFVTDHSGIGGAHLDPNIPEAVVEKLNDLMVRVVDGYHTGIFAEPIPWQGETQPSGNDPTSVKPVE